MLQNMIVGAIVAVAFFYLLRKFFFRKKNTRATGSRCGSCSGCSKGGGCH